MSDSRFALGPDWKRSSCLFPIFLLPAFCCSFKDDVMVFVNNTSTYGCFNQSYQHVTSKKQCRWLFPAHQGVWWCTVLWTLCGGLVTRERAFVTSWTCYDCYLTSNLPSKSGSKVAFITAWLEFPTRPCVILTHNSGGGGGWGVWFFFWLFLCVCVYTRVYVSACRQMRVLQNECVG